ncbi:Sodium-coupled monocarboxylate transporter 2 [Armadillidium vulgare]|nr:Sodium-coupled monocarboxylate transporter 2 [Armadillidium vulgare]
MKFKLFSSAKPLTCALINKVLSFLCGCLFIGLAFLTAKGASIIHLAFTAFGISMGLIFGVFILGICFPISNIKGAVGGMLVSFVLLFWIFIGSLIYGEPPKRLPLSTEFCQNTSFTNESLNQPDVSFNNTIPDIGISSEEDSYGNDLRWDFITASSIKTNLNVSEIKKRSEVPPELVFNWSKLFSKHDRKLSEDLILNVKD